MSTTLQGEVTHTKLSLEDKVALMGENRTQSCVGREGGGHGKSWEKDAKCNLYLA